MQQVSVIQNVLKANDEVAAFNRAKFKTAGARYTRADDISAKDLKRWLANAAKIQWDYKNIVKRKGVSHFTR